MIICPELKKIPYILHGFFGSTGGVSEGIYATLNCGPGSSDKPENVSKNRAIAMQMLKAPEDSLCSLYQCHSNKVVIMESPGQAAIEADAMVSKTPGITLGILTADCVPVLFADKNAKIIGAAHAGWKGAIGNILKNTVEEMCALGAKKEHIIAAIGPCIHQQSYEVSDDFRENFMQENSSNERFFKPGKKDGKSFFNIPGYVCSKLDELRLHKIEDANIDTLSNTDKFFSYRRNCLNNEKDYGRQLSAIHLKI